MIDLIFLLFGHRRVLGAHTRLFASRLTRRPVAPWARLALSGAVTLAKRGR